MNRGLGAISGLMSRLNTPDVLNQLSDALKAEIVSEEGKSLPSTFFTPSSMICKRQMFYKAKGIEPEPSDADYQMTGMAESGTDRHNRLQNHLQHLKDFEYVDVSKYIEENHIDVEVVSHIGNEWKLRNQKYNLSFMLDGILLHKPTGKYYVLEIKTEISFKSNGRKDVDPFHKHQGLAYTQMLKIPDVIFIYENRDDCSLKFYLYTPTPEEIEKYFRKKLSDVLYALEIDKVPKMVTTEDISMTEVISTSKVCNYCPYKKQCGRDLNV